MTPPPAVVAPAPGPAPAPYSHCHGGAASPCANRRGQHHFNLHDLFAKFHHNDCGCQQQTCDNGCGGHHFNLHDLFAKFHHNDCGCQQQNTCDCQQTNHGSCGHSFGNHGCFLHNLLSKFHHNDCGSNDCGCNGGPGPVYTPAPGAPGAMPKVGAPIPAPGGSPGQPLPKGQTSIQIIPQQNAPALDSTPTTTRPAEIKEPF